MPPRSRTDSEGDDPFAGVEKKLADGLGRWTTLAADTVQARGAADVASVVRKFQKFLFKLVRSLFQKMREILNQLDPFGVAQAVGSFVASGVEDLIDGFNELLGELAEGTAAVSDAAIGAVLGIVEAIKKVFHLILDAIKLPHITRPAELFLDMIDNVLGDIAEMVSAVSGKMARTFRNNMYGQLAMIRAADAARDGYGPVDERRDDD